MKSIYQSPSKFKEQGIDDKVLQKFGLDRPMPDLAPWKEMVQRIVAPHERVRVAVVGKYTDFVDSYKSVQESLIHGGIANDVGVDISWVSSDDFVEAPTARRILGEHEGLLVPGGCGVRGGGG